METNVRRVKRTPAEMVDWYREQIRHAKENSVYLKVIEVKKIKEVV